MTAPARVRIPKPEPVSQQEINRTLSAFAELRILAPALDPIELRRRLLNLTYALDGLIARLA